MAGTFQVKWTNQNPDEASEKGIDVFHGGAGGAAALPSILAGYLLGQKMEDFHG